MQCGRVQHDGQVALEGILDDSIIVLAPAINLSPTMLFETRQTLSRIEVPANPSGNS